MRVAPERERERVVGRVEWGGKTRKGNNAPCESTATAYVANSSQTTTMFILRPLY